MLKCAYCQLKYEKSRNVKHRHKDYCSKPCVEDAIDVEAQVHGIYVATDDNPGRDLFDWSFNRI